MGREGRKGQEKRKKWKGGTKEREKKGDEREKEVGKGGRKRCKI